MASKEMRNLVTDAVRKERTQYLKYIKVRHSPKKLWSTLQDFHVYSKSSNNLQENLSDPNLVNQHFVQSISSKVHEATLNYYSTRRLSGNPNSFYFTKVNEGDICEAVNSIRSNSTGFDGINLHMLKLCFPEVVPYLLHLYNTCINIIRLHLAVLVHKVITRQEPEYLVSKLKLRLMCHGVNVRHGNQLSIPKHRSAAFERSFCYNSVTIYNAIPPEIKLKHYVQKTS
nr:unnamed protein product [Callosobruchus analis]